MIACRIISLNLCHKKLYIKRCYQKKKPLDHHRIYVLGLTLCETDKDKNDSTVIYIKRNTLGVDARCHELQTGDI